MPVDNIRIPRPICKDPSWQYSIACENCALCNHVFLAALSPEELDRVLSPIEPLNFPPQALLYRTGDTDDWIYTIRSGLIKQVQYGQDGSYRIVRLNRGGDSIGLERFSGDPFEHTAITVNQVAACRIPISVLGRLNHNSPWLYKQLIKQWHRESREADTWITEFSTGPIRTRIARLIRFLSAFSSEKKVGQVELLGREDMAAIIGATVESVSRVIASLKRESVLRPVKTGSNEICEFDTSALDRLIGGN